MRSSGKSKPEAKRAKQVHPAPAPAGAAAVEGPRTRTGDRGRRPGGGPLRGTALNSEYDAVGQQPAAPSEPVREAWPAELEARSKVVLPRGLPVPAGTPVLVHKDAPRCAGGPGTAKKPAQREDAVLTVKLAADGAKGYQVSREHVAVDSEWLSRAAAA